jgi:hypothetical protein
MVLPRSLVRSFSFLVALSAFTIFIASEALSAQAPASQYDKTLKQMLDAVQSKSYDQFLAQGDANFKVGFKQKMFEDLSAQLGPRLQQGYSTTFLTTLHQQDYTVHVWKLAFKDGKDDFLVTMAVKDGKVSGLVFR